MPENSLHIAPKHLNVDLRLEVLANEMLDAGVALDQLLVSPQGGFYRGFRRDVAEVAIIEDNLGDPLYYQIKTSRNGIYDGIPENLFHDKLYDVQEGKDIDPVENVKRNRKEEEAARSFFQVVEKEIYRLKILFEQEERKSIIGTSQFSQHEIFLQIWSELDKDRIGPYISQLTQILPLASKYHGNIEVIQIMLEYLLQAPVHIRLDLQNGSKVHTKIPCVLGEARSGVDSVLGGVFHDFEPAFFISIGPVSPETLELFMPDQVGTNALRIFCDYYFPLNSKINFEYGMNKTQGTVVLTDQSNKIREEVSPVARLGISSFI